MKLKKGKKDTQKKYGSFQTFVEWGSDKKFIDRYSDAKADVGYVFVKAAPYFSVSVDSVQNKNPEQIGALSKAKKEAAASLWRFSMF